MNATIAALHSVDPEAVGLGDYGRPGNYFGRQISRWSRQYLEDTEAGRDADMDALENQAEPVCQYEPKPTPAELGLYKSQCRQIVAAIHERRDFIKQMDSATCAPCVSRRISTIPHTCMLCLCRGSHKEDMLVDER